MQSPFRPLLKVLFLALVAVAVGTLFGCGDGPGAPQAQPARNIYVIQNTSTNGVESDSVLAISATASGTATPASTLQLPANVVGFALATGPDGTIYVGAAAGENSGEILVYAAGASGAATPTATLSGGAQGTFTIPLFLTVSSKGQLYVFSSDGSIESFAKGVTSAGTPAQYLTYGMTTSDYYGGLGVDDAGEIFLADAKAGAIEVFAPGANGAALPARSITSTPTASFADLYGMAVDGAGNITVANYNSADDPFPTFGKRPVELAYRRLAPERFTEAPRPRATLAPAATSVFSFAAGANGAATPTRTLSGAATRINEPEGLAVDAVGNMYYEDYEGGAVTLMVFPAAATGNVAPKAAITSTAFTTSYFGALAAF